MMIHEDLDVSFIYSSDIVHAFAGSPPNMLIQLSLFKVSQTDHLLERHRPMEIPQ